jgi:uncharacterized protein
LKAMWSGMFCLLLVGGCATRTTDHFYVLNALPAAVDASRVAPTSQIILKVTLPSVVDRPELVLDMSPGEVRVLEHHRWAAPLPDLVRQTLGRDIERRRSDVVVADLRSESSKVPVINISVDFIHFSVRPGVDAHLEANWRIVNANAAPDVMGGNVFHSTLKSGDYSAVAQAVSEAVAALADELVAKLPPGG